MRLEEAAEILGVSVDTPVETLKQTYRKLALHWHPDKVRFLGLDIFLTRHISLIFLEFRIFTSI